MCLLVALLFLGSLSTYAQTSNSGPFEGFGGYSYIRFDTSPTTTSATVFNGFELSGQYRFTTWLGGVADFGGSAGNLGIAPSIVTYLFGPEVSFPVRVSPFAHVLVGAAHFGVGNGSDKSFTTAVEGGIDLRLTRGIYWRVIQGDYRPTRFNGATQNNVRVATGLEVRFHIGAQR
jgi:hypothetical protein